MHRLGWFSIAELERILIFTIGVVFISYMLELYNLARHMNIKEIFLRNFAVVFFSFFLLTAAYYMMRVPAYIRGDLAMMLGFFCIYQFLWRVGYRLLINSSHIARKVIVLGTGPLAKKIGDLIQSTNHQHVLGGYLNLTSEPVAVPTHAIVGNGGSIAETIKKEKAHKLVVSLTERRGAFPLQDVLDCKFSGIEVIDAPTFYENVTGKLLIENITPSWFIFSDGFNLNASVRLFKRVIDIICSIIGLVLALPFFPIVAFFVKLDSPGPIFFRQLRVGEKDRNFVLFKFRTMRQDAEQATGAVWAQKNDPRITRIGKFLRKSRIDELPQFYNVLKGEMSFIGPRPERPEFVEKLKSIVPYYSERHFVKPGITGWAQIRYPYGASAKDALEKLRYDLYYIKNLSVFLELTIIFETLKVMLFGRGAR
jgi:sugar transferase (PEP-CTERM system associated)